MAMSRKDYIAIARAISDGQFIDCKSPAELAMQAAVRRKISDQIANYCGNDNFRFQRSKFIEACGFGAGRSGDILPPGAKLARAANSANGR